MSNTLTPTFLLNPLTLMYLYRKLPNCRWEHRIPTIQDVLDWSEDRAGKAWRDAFFTDTVSIVTKELLERTK